ncbi:MAG: RDD family protein [Oleibacter sp.]|nr:RDD family protein [Thalassolituus sp.]
MSLANYPTASLMRRLLALAYDSLIIIAIYILIGGILVTLISKALGYAELPRLSPAMAASLMYSFIFLYYMHSWRRGGQTIGMKAWGLYAITEDGSQFRLSHAILRSVAGGFSIVLFGLGFWWMLFDKKQRTWHDMASLTKVVYKPKNLSK